MGMDPPTVQRNPHFKKDTLVRQADIVGILRRTTDHTTNVAFGHWALDDQQMANLIHEIVLECSRVAKLTTGNNKVCDAIEQHLGIMDNAN